jgi:hypothetical protein
MNSKESAAFKSAMHDIFVNLESDLSKMYERKKKLKFRLAVQKHKMSTSEADSPARSETIKNLTSEIKWLERYYKNLFNQLSAAFPHFTA